MNIILAELLPVLFFLVVATGVIVLGSKWGAHAATEAKKESSPAWKAYFISSMPAVGCFAGGIMANYQDGLVTLCWLLACACVVTTFIKYYNLRLSRS